VGDLRAAKWFQFFAHLDARDPRRTFRRLGTDETVDAFSGRVLSVTAWLAAAMVTRLTIRFEDVANRARHGGSRGRLCCLWAELGVPNVIVTTASTMRHCCPFRSISPSPGCPCPFSRRLRHRSGAGSR
jgi:hypothetical protein